MSTQPRFKINREFPGTREALCHKAMPPPGRKTKNRVPGKNRAERFSPCRRQTGRRE